MGKKLFLLSQSQLVQAIKSKNISILGQFYTSNYYKTETMVFKSRGTAEHAKNIYQEAFTTVWKQVNNNNFKPQNETALRDYLYRIAKNKWKDALKFENSRPLNSATFKMVKEEEFSTEDLKNYKIEVAMQAFKNLGEPCKQLLKSFYFEKKSLREIATALNIEESTARNKKFRCMEKLRNMVLAAKEL